MSSDAPGPFQPGEGKNSPIRRVDRLRRASKLPAGKTHAMCAIGYRLVQAGRSVLFIPAYRLVQDMLAAKRDLDLPRMLRKLDNFELLVIDDLGYLPQGAEE
ncbi:MAG: ATP-binding protein [Dehalococcoidia bacterium]|nr:ATP-binding protein [Dehalococcoidia bacterium]